MVTLTLKSFQPRARGEQLARDGVLVGDWAHVLGGCERAYRAAVDAMVERGIDTGGRPPIWAWCGQLTLLDAMLLFDEEYELSRGIVTITFSAPSELVMLSDYQHWCDALFANQRTWTPRPPRTASDAHPDELVHPTQACLPYLRAEWVRDIVPLPRSGWDELDPAQPV